jgi:hypothetical protein
VAEHEVDPREHKQELRLTEMADPLREDAAINRDALRTFATESFGSPVRAAVRTILPGAAAHRRLLVSGTTTTVAM